MLTATPSLGACGFLNPIFGCFSVRPSLFCCWVAGFKATVVCEAVRVAQRASRVCLTQFRPLRHTVSPLSLSASFLICKSGDSNTYLVRSQYVSVRLPHLLL